MSTSDRELLELAAKAAGLRWSYDLNLKTWNPLTDDRDALRLAVVLRIETEFYAETAYAGQRKTAKYAVDTLDDQDMLVATRRAIVLAAAEIGRSMG